MRRERRTVPRIGGLQRAGADQLRACAAKNAHRTGAIAPASDQRAPAADRFADAPFNRADAAAKRPVATEKIPRAAFMTHGRALFTLGDQRVNPSLCYDRRRYEN